MKIVATNVLASRTDWNADRSELGPNLAKNSI